MSSDSRRKQSVKSDTRHGKHKPTKVMFGAMVELETKAIAVLAASMNNVSLVDIVINGIMNEATKAGIVENGQVKAEFKEAVENISASLKEELIKKRRNRK